MYVFLGGQVPNALRRTDPSSLGRMSETLNSAKWIFLPQETQLTPVSRAWPAFKRYLPTLTRWRSATGGSGALRTLRFCQTTTTTNTITGGDVIGDPHIHTFEGEHLGLKFRKVFVSFCGEICWLRTLRVLKRKGWMAGTSLESEKMIICNYWHDGSIWNIRFYVFLPFTYRHPLTIVEIMGYHVRNVALGVMGDPYKEPSPRSFGLSLRQKQTRLLDKRG